jgi:NAD(P)H-hydrate repair Nnr-like enzyme with NAD(P)H-hydrate epimerase domain
MASESLMRNAGQEVYQVTIRWFEKVAPY